MSEQPTKKPIIESSMNIKKSVSIEEVVEGGRLSNLINDGIQCLLNASNITSEYALINISLNAATVETTAEVEETGFKIPVEIIDEDDQQSLHLLNAAAEKRLQDRCHSKRIILEKIQNKRNMNLKELTETGRLQDNCFSKQVEPEKVQNKRKLNLKSKHGKKQKCRNSASNSSTTSITPKPPITPKPSISPKPTISLEPSVSLKPPISSEPHISSKPFISLKPLSSLQNPITSMPPISLNRPISLQPPISSKALSPTPPISQHIYIVE